MSNKLLALFLALLMTTTTFVFVSNEYEVLATPGGGGGDGWINETSLDYSFLWESIQTLSNVTHLEIWNETNDIRKGRAFGTPGDNWTAQYIWEKLKYEWGFEGVIKDKLKTIASNDDGSILPWKCDFKIETIDFELQINNENYTMENPVPKNETFTLPSANWNNVGPPGYHSRTYKRSFTNAKIINKSAADILNRKGITTDHYYNVTGLNETGKYLISGNATYINLTDSLPEDQEGRVFLFPEEEGIDAHLNNVTNASAVILIHNASRSEGEEEHWESTSNYTCQIARVNNTDNNLTEVLNKLKEGVFIVVDNYLDNETLMFIHNFSYIDCWCPKNNYFVVTQTTDAGTISTITSDLFWNNMREDVAKCLGFIVFDKNEYYTTDVKASAHIMEATLRHWRGTNRPGEEFISYNTIQPRLQIFSVNYTIGKWLEENASTTTVTGYFNQSENNVDAYNVLVNINRENNPQDKITILSSRFDSWWGECPGDSGVGTCIILAIAKYFKENNITPKNNLSFLFTTGEEYRYRGAWYHSITHKSDNIVRWIGTDQLGMNAPNFGQVTDISDDNPNGDVAIIDTIVDIYNLEEESGNEYRNSTGSDGNGLDAMAFVGREDLWGPSYSCKTICISKARINTSSKVKWDYHHRAGQNYTEGDSMKYIDPKDVNATYNFTWGVTKYYCVNPDSWFDSATYTAIDTDDGNTYVDSIKADFTIKSILPHDYVMVNATLRENNAYGDVYNYSCTNYSINSTGLETSITLTLPENKTEGYYVLRLDLYNSTGMIDSIVTDDYNDYINQTDFCIDKFIYPYNSHKNPPNITNISASPNLVGYAFNVTISADVTSDVGSDIEIVGANITYPDKTINNYTMSNTVDDSYECIFNSSWQRGEYSFIIWAKDENGNMSGSSHYYFNVSSEAKITVCTIKDTYAKFERVNLTDPPIASSETSNEFGYEFLDDGKVLRIWNRFDSYYFNISNGIQFTNHKDEYWSTNVLMLGYYNNDVWNLIYRTDKLSGFNKNIISDNETYVNATLWKDLTYQGYDFRLAIRYYLGVDDNELTVIPYIKNLDEEDIPYVLGFGWELKDIQIDMTTIGDYIEINGTTYYLNQILDETYTDMDSACYYIKEDLSDTQSKSLYLKWDENLNYKVKIKSRDGQYNAPVTLFIRVGILNSGQEKYTEMYWYDADQITYYFDDYDTNEDWPINPGNMIDGNESTYSSTTVYNNVQLCDNNTCNGSYLGTISKVELRTKAYYTGLPVDLKLRPVYSGTTDGNNYTYDVPSGPPGQWSD